MPSDLSLKHKLHPTLHLLTVHACLECDTVAQLTGIRITKIVKQLKQGITFETIGIFADINYVRVKVTRFFGYLLWYGRAQHV